MCGTHINVWGNKRDGCAGCIEHMLEIRADLFMSNRLRNILTFKRIGRLIEIPVV